MRTWLPERGVPYESRRTPVVVLGHGGGRSEDAEEITAIANAFGKRACAVLACDWPGHGRQGEEPGDSPEEILRRAASLICDPEVWVMATKEWEVALDGFVEEHGLGPVGYWGLSLGTVMGIGVAARVSVAAAVLGLAGVVPSLAENMHAAARSLACPVRFLHQVDDELFPAGSVTALHAAMCNADLEVRRNRGGHFDVPLQEILGSVTWLAERLHAT